MTPDKQAAPSEWVERAMKLSRVCAVKSLNKDVRSFYAANEDLRAHLESREALVKQLAEALKELSYACTDKAEAMARAALAAYQEKT